MRDRRGFLGAVAGGLACLAATPLTAGRQPRPLSRQTMNGWARCRMSDLRNGEFWKFDDGDGKVWQAAGEPAQNADGVWSVQCRETGRVA